MTGERTEVQRVHPVIGARPGQEMLGRIDEIAQTYRTVAEPEK